MQQATNAFCVGNYWPVTNGAVSDTVGGMNATCSLPRFTTDRFGVANEAITVMSSADSWRLPFGRYYQGDTTMTMWVNKLQCSSYGPYGINMIYFSISFEIT
jgi:hypothetical protein